MKSYLKLRPIVKNSLDPSILRLESKILNLGSLVLLLKIKYTRWKIRCMESRLSKKERLNIREKRVWEGEKESRIGHARVSCVALGGRGSNMG